MESPVLACEETRLKRERRMARMTLDQRRVTFARRSSQSGWTRHLDLSFAVSHALLDI